MTGMINRSVVLTAIALCGLGLFAMRSIDVTFEEMVRESPVIVTGKVTKVKVNRSKCDGDTAVTFDVTGMVKGRMKERAGTYHDSYPVSRPGCPSVHFYRYRGKIFTASDVGAEAVFYFGSRYGHGADGMDRLPAVRALLK